MMRLDKLIKYIEKNYPSCKFSIYAVPNFAHVITDISDWFKETTSQKKVVANLKNVL